MQSGVRLTGLGVGALALVSVGVLRRDAPTLAHRLQGRGAPLVVVSGVAALAALWLVRQGRCRAARVPALVAVVAVVGGWGVAQYPWLLVDQMRIADAAAPRATLVALLVAFLAAGLLVVPALVWLLRLTNAGRLGDEQRADSSQALLDRLSREGGPG